MQGKALPDQSAQAQVYVGVDVCKDWLDVYFHPLGKALRIANVRIPTQAGRGFRFHSGHRSDLKPATIPR